MQVSKLTITALALGAIVYSSKANATDLPLTTLINLESKLQLAQTNLQEAAIYFNSGIKLLEQGDYQGAINYFTQAIQINPELVAAYYNRAIARHQLQQYQKAIANFTKVIQINHKITIAYNNWGVAGAELKDYQLDIAYSNRGISHGLSGDEARGMTDLKKAVSLYRNQGEKAKA
ncbi:tetratricopeptide repeat protein [Calothrix sp. CCY 0018]|uniref:tetratricopeptide repeat protein n=1 Tax=Calothrix sp. CCY 0018 TaxID=3103864 RepID=UPI0039C60A24